MPDNSLELSFDIYQRYRGVSTLLAQCAHSSGMPNPRVLDVGAGHENYLGLFQPDFEVTGLDVREPPEGSNYPYFVLGNALSLPFENQSFDLCCSVDNLEHMSPEDRQKAIDEMVRVSRGSIVLAFPSGENQVTEYEALANSFYSSLFGQGYLWLEEHSQFPLPTAEEISSYAARAHGLRARSFPNGYLPRWMEMMTFQLLANQVPFLKPYWEKFCRLYNEQIYPFDNKAPSYRQIVVLHRTSITLSFPVQEESAQFHVQYGILRNAMWQRYLADGITNFLLHNREHIELKAARATLDQLQRQIDLQASALFKAKQEKALLEKRTADLNAMKYQINSMQASATWRVGRMAMIPLRLLRKIRNRLRRPPSTPQSAKDLALLVQFTPSNPENPYYVLTGQNLRKLGWRYEYDNDPVSLLEKLNRQRGRPALVHFHQFEPYLRPEKGKTSEQRTEEFTQNLQKYKQAGARLVWTLHNRLPHDASPQDIALAQRMHEFVGENFDGIFVMGEAARREAEKYIAPEKVFLVPHMNFQGFYGPPVAKTEARARLGIPEAAFVFGTLGALRPYKGIELIMEAFKGLGGENLRLLIAGGTKSPEYLEELQQIAATDPRILLHGESKIPGPDIPLWLGAIDTAVFAFRDILSSSSVILALSYDRPVIAPDNGDIPAVAVPGQTGFLYQTNDAASLQQAMQAAWHSPLQEHMRLMTDSYMKKISPEAVARKTEEVYAKLLEIHLN